MVDQFTKSCGCMWGSCLCGIESPPKEDFLYFDSIKKELFESNWGENMGKFFKKYRNQFVEEFHRTEYSFIGKL